ncbi:MAG TPA: NAD-dependent epimerase/dehydratase family protein [Dehalococcoidia bacterium]|nr:NAD-dependent epimerase/dehydratase family protein [Dehalococcoidia bacterium]
MNVLVTGGAGFIGAHLVDRIVGTTDDHVVVLDNLRRGRRQRIRQHEPYLTFVEGDIRDRDVLRSAMQGCDVVYHLAAQSNVMGAIEDAEYSFTTNVGGTFNVLLTAAELGVRRVVFSSSREVYGEPEYVPVDEDHPLRPKNPYGASKLAGEAYCRTFAHCYGIDVAVCRLANVYGVGDRDRVIPLWLERASGARDLEVFGGNQILDFVWIGRVVDALLHAGEHGLPETTNIGSGTGTSILELAARIISVAGSSARSVRLPARGPEVGRFVADTSRMRALGLEPDADPLAHLPEVARSYGVMVPA